MAKRCASEAPEDGRQAKRIRTTSDRLSTLSHELILRVLSFLPVADLASCHRLSREFSALAGDPQLWKALYYNRFVRPRASRIPGIRNAGAPVDSLHFSSKVSKWLGEEGLVKRGKETNWRRQYKLRQNWLKGSCAVSEIKVAEEPTIPPISVQMHDGIVYMADHSGGLRAWNSKAEKRILAETTFHHLHRQPSVCPPTSLAVDLTTSPGDRTQIAVGFQDGSFGVYELNAVAGEFRHRYTHEPSSNGTLTAVAMSFPYLSTMTATQLLSVYRFDDSQLADFKQDVLDPPRLLHSLHSQTVWPPLTLSIRPTADTILVCIAYAVPTILHNWTVGIQEMRMMPSGEVLESRLATANDRQYRSLIFDLPSALGTLASSDSTTDPAGPHNSHTKPTSLSYTHPYLLVSHPDNTLTVYLVSSTAQFLTISAGNRLWGHTSSVSVAHVGGRGKAVSVSSRGDELRVWELEGETMPAASRRRLAPGSLSVRVRAESNNLTGMDAAHGPGLGVALEHRFDERSLTRGFVGFDEENVVVLKEKDSGRQALMIYDFT